MTKNLQKQGSKMTLRRSFWFIFTLCQLAFVGVQAQDRSITGVVIGSDDNAGIPGVSIKVMGTNKGTNSSANGQFTVSASTNSVLEFSMIGYTSKSVTVGNQSTLKVVLDVDNRQLQEVVVTALGIKKDIRRIGVAIQSVDGSSTIKAREPNAINALSGRVAGLTVGAQPELLRKPNISLRGSSTILYVVDGVPINSDTWNISPDDIETYSVLKGASASALYGFRGKNGAI